MAFGRKRCSFQVSSPAPQHVPQQNACPYKFSNLRLYISGVIQNDSSCAGGQVPDFIVDWCWVLELLVAMVLINRYLLHHENLRMKTTKTITTSSALISVQGGQHDTRSWTSNLYFCVSSCCNRSFGIHLLFFSNFRVFWGDQHCVPGPGSVSPQTNQKHSNQNKYSSIKPHNKTIMPKGLR